MEQVDRSLKQIALVMHAMTPSDREKILAQLEAQVASKVDALIADLNAIGFVPQFDFLESVVSLPGNIAPHKNEDVKVAQLNMFEKIDLADIKILTQVLMQEPDRVVALLLNIQPWSWEMPFLQTLNSYQRKKLNDTRIHLVSIGAEQENTLMNIVHKRYEMALNASLKPGKTIFSLVKFRSLKVLRLIEAAMKRT